ncbi:MAG: hypothetical protein IPG90_09620 [Bacteroidetes bacterium]|nr:hypothetical protein [Bacteroidota bacterium]MBK6838490.1 hypothetical protein [Bacteroidota bacterium]MBK9526431.1 hypothetical protein [Bacteroidota bacterium]MBK9543988.1 hypothetical protein [Bacteroidota bacterium]MBL0256544.1 hypothetical protein [Bacteroidota bacterium]
MKYLRLFTLLIFATLLVFACKKPDEYPVIPAIEYKSAYTTKDNQGFDQLFYVTISFTDGDGDIGYKSRESGENDPIFDDPTSQYYNNFIVKMFIKQNGVWNTIDTPVSSRIPYLTPDGKNKALKGDILRELNLPFPLLNDTMKYDIFIYDRALHQSNTITTPEFIFNTH